MHYNSGSTVGLFRLVKTTKIREEGIFYEWEHCINGAKLIWFATKDENKHFSAAFKTIPTDNTGIFHIIEHSVLCGSEKYPVKEPFVDLLKSSMNTFMNAMTFPDKTMYPVSSRNAKDFANLVDVYLDAIFAPKMITNPNIFYQEGWHFELTDDKKPLDIKGVVYSEMKGAFSSYSKIADREMNRLLYPDTCYRFVSGGDPDEIPCLSYEQFVAGYRKYYHPTNAIFYLEGDLDFEGTVAKISSYVDMFSRGETFTIPYQEPTKARESSCYYQAAGDPKYQGHIYYEKIACNFNDKFKTYAIATLARYLSETNESPIKKAILDSGFARDISISIDGSAQQIAFYVAVKNADLDKKQEIKAIIIDKISEIVKYGLDREMLLGNINSMEFESMETDEPAALYHNYDVLDSALYGGEASDLLLFDDAYDFLRRNLDTDYYERLLEELFDFSDMQTVYVIPSSDIDAQKNEELSAKLEKIKDNMSLANIRTLIQLNNNLLEWQKTPDRPEDSATIPHLEKSDINPLPQELSVDEAEISGVKVLHYHLTDPRVKYIKFYFAVDETSPDRASMLAFLPKILMNVKTKTHSTLELQKNLLKYVGDVGIAYNAITYKREQFSCRQYMVVSIAVLSKYFVPAMKLISEVLLTSEISLDSEKEFRSLVSQTCDKMKLGMVRGGLNFAARLASASFSSQNSWKEATSGYFAYEKIKLIDGNFDNYKNGVINYLADSAKRIFDKNRLTIAVAGTDIPDFSGFIASLPCDSAPVSESFFPVMHKKNTAIIVPAKVSYAVRHFDLGSFDNEIAGRFMILSNMLNYDYLWNTIRVQGGAYGTGASVSPSGSSLFYSYRDPNPLKSLDAFAKTGDYVRSVNNFDDIDSYIISTFAECDPLKSNPDIAADAFNAYLTGNTYDDRKARRIGMMNSTPAKLAALARTFDSNVSESTVCVVGDRASVQRISDNIPDMEILEI